MIIPNINESCLDDDARLAKPCSSYWGLIRPQEQRPLLVTMKIDLVNVALKLC